jgi:hypothetical protein
MNRRSLLKLICASVGLSAVPRFSADLKLYEPVRWVTAEFTYGTEFGVAGEWFQNGKMLRHAFKFPTPYGISEKMRKSLIADAKNVLRAWYRDVGRKK